MWNRREGAPYRLRAALKKFAEHDVDLPKPVARAVELLDRIEANPVPDPSPHTLHDAVLDGASLDQLDQLALRQLAHGRVRDAWAQARLTAAANALDAILDCRNEIHAALAEVADDCISKLERIAELGDARLDTLIREGKTDAARLVADKELTGSQLNELYQFRDVYLTPPEIDPRPHGVDCTRWREPRKVRNLHGDNVLDTLITGLKRGGQLWYPSAAEAAEAAAPIVAEHQAAGERRRQNQHGIGHVAI
ncbi:hypothetical protein H7I53_18370 [Mycolicibacterium pulveris]|uniref:Uncharacterized protein n=1 Tax=Mycolicibacterium pulveris TaxID=36813 RepID=A0A7I7URW3_MYCPV|nr:hypothetical protein [Mycolicibacterium pulveris]MCV6982182.1 hypothetical protein [Mycolicibacterium pulveris]BBY84172.1 hypothetical protein MPUL_53300 [Mycolicibacterium pulveris]